MGKFDKDTIVILGIFLFTIILYLFAIIYFTERDLSNHVHHTNCYAPIGDYALEPGKSSDSILTSCGANKNNLCCYSASSLPDAINFVQQNKGRKFTYHENTKNTCIVDPTNTNYKNNSQSSVYTMTRHNINQKSDGATKKEVEKNFDTSLSDKIVNITALQPRSLTQGLG